MTPIDKVCPICQGTFAALECHHIIPQATSSVNLKEEVGEGPTINLCSTCHKHLHYTALSEIKGTGKVYFTPAQYQRAKRTLNVLKLSLLREQHLPKDEEQIKKFFVRLTVEQIAKLDKFKERVGMSSRQQAIEYLVSSLP